MEAPAPATDAYLSIDAVSKRFGETRALRDVTLAVERGAFVALLGPSGCGKSTLLKIIAGLADADHGQLALDRTRLDTVPAYRRDIGLVFQSYALFPHLSVRANVRFGLEMRGIARSEMNDRVEEALGLVKLGGYGDRMPAELSGGQQQRVALARAIVVRPRLLLLDEPLSNLDAVLRKSVRVEIRELHDRTGLTTVMVTHDQEEAMSIADRVAVMSDGQIIQYGPPEELYERPATAFVASFVGNPPGMLLPLRRSVHGGWLLAGEPWLMPEAVSDAVAGRGDLSLGLRPERVRLVADSGAPNVVRGRVRSSEYLGGSWLVHVDIGSFAPAAMSDSRSPPIGTPVGIEIDPTSILVFDEASGDRIST